ncbi:hypothetical protein [Rhodococcus marinonascens]|uniref:hypothetical protein n=1 Tax=Rhodococcus marinonascens TaxID=38311 RepID=UPI0009329A3A|nr:hypothetical protein [Rhodococcus marinonascens]
MLDLSSQETAQLLSVGERAVRGWETGTAKTVPAGVIAELAQLEQDQDDVVRELEEIGRRSGIIVIYRGDGVVPDRPELPARWHRVAAATALRNLAVDGIDVRIVYAAAADREHAGPPKITT